MNPSRHRAGLLSAASHRDCGRGHGLRHHPFPFHGRLPARLPALLHPHHRVSALCHGPRSAGVHPRGPWLYWTATGMPGRMQQLVNNRSHDRERCKLCKFKCTVRWKLQQGLKHAPFFIAAWPHAAAGSAQSAACRDGASVLAHQSGPERVGRSDRPPSCAATAVCGNRLPPQQAAGSWASTWAPATPPSP